MRMRRKPWVRTELAESIIFIDNPQMNIGKWNNLFKRKENPMHLELRMWQRKFYCKVKCTKSTNKLSSNRYKK